MKSLLGAVTVLTTLVSAQTNTYERTLNIVWANTGGQQFPQYNNTYLFEQLARIKPGLTSVVPFLLNVANIDNYNSTLTGLKDMGITVQPAFGDHTAHPVNSSFYKGVARGYKKYTDYVRIENVQAYSEEKNGLAKLVDMIDYLSDTLGFEHIMLNSWPKVNGQFIKFNNSAVDASINPVLLQESANYNVIPAKNNWYPNFNAALKLFNVSKTASFLINYEDKPQEAALAKLSTADDQIAAMNTTLFQIEKREGYVYDTRIYWTAPFSQNYNPIVENTWDYIIEQLSSM